jgi:hypothetical protein
MKKLLALLLALAPAFAFATGNENALVLSQRNATDTNNITRFMMFPSGVEGILWFDATTVTPAVLQLGTSLTIASGVLNCTPASAPRSQSAVTRSLNSGFQISTTRDAQVFYSVQITVTASIAGGQDGDLFLEIASDSGFTTNLQVVAVSLGSQSYSLAVALQGVQKGPLNVSGYVPAGYYTRLRTANNVGTPTYLYRAGQEILL